LTLGDVDHAASAGEARPLATRETMAMNVVARGARFM
jgi:hypothetical protein